MLIFAIVLLLIGVLLLFAAPRVAAGGAGSALHVIGWVFVLGGAICLIIWIARQVDAEDADASLPVAMLSIGMVATTGPTAAASRPRPVVLAFLATAVPVLCAFALQVLEATDALDSALWLRTVLVGLGPLVGVLAAAWAQAQVTPLEDPRDDAGRALLPSPQPKPGRNR